METPCTSQQRVWNAAMRCAHSVCELGACHAIAALQGLQTSKMEPLGAGLELDEDDNGDNKAAPKASGIKGVEKGLDFRPFLPCMR